MTWLRPSTSLSRIDEALAAQATAHARRATAAQGVTEAARADQERFRDTADRLAIPRHRAGQSQRVADALQALLREVDRSDARSH